jgi:hypothetical protein
MHEHMAQVYSSLGTGFRDALRFGRAKVVADGDLARRSNHAGL